MIFKPVWKVVYSGGALGCISSCCRWYWILLL